MQNIETKVQMFMDGQEDLLLQREVLSYYAGRTQREGLKDREWAQILNCLYNSDENIRKNSLSLFTIGLASSPHGSESRNWIFALDNFASWILLETSYFPEQATFYKTLMPHLEMLLYRAPERCTSLFTALNAVATGAEFKDKRIKREVLLSLEFFLSSQKLSQLWAYYVDSHEEKRSELVRIFPCLGIKAGRYFFHLLIHSCSAQERLLLLDVLGKFHHSFNSVLLECLAAKPPWFIARNILYIQNNLQVEINQEHIEQYLVYQDVRVQELLVQTLKEMGGDWQIKKLFFVLPSLQPHLQSNIIEFLAQHDDEQVCERLIDFLKSNFHKFLDNEKVPLVLCELLRFYPSAEAQQILEELQNEIIARPRLARLKHFVKRTKGEIEPLLRHEMCKIEVPDANSSDKAFYKEKIIEKKTEEIISQFKKTGKSSDVNLALILRNIVEKYFDPEEYFSQDDLAQAGLILRRAQEISPECVESYRALFDELDKEHEVADNAFTQIESFLTPYFPTQKLEIVRDRFRFEKYRTGECVFKESEINPSLYLLLDGEIYCSAKSYGENVFLKKLSRGALFGYNLFFDGGLWTERGVATMTSFVGCLSYYDVENLLDDTEIREGLTRLCQKQPRMAACVYGAGIERRSYRRVEYRKNGIIHFMDHMRNELSEGQGMLIENISQHGMAIYVCLSEEKNVHSFLGTEVLVLCNALKCSLKGYIVSVRHIAENRYCIHLFIQEEVDMSFL